MADQYARLGGAQRKLAGGRARIGGTVYDIKRGRTLVNGTGYDIILTATPGRTELQQLFTDAVIAEIAGTDSAVQQYATMDVSSYTADTYWLFGFHDGNCCIYKLKNGIMSLLNNSGGMTLTKSGNTVSTTGEYYGATIILLDLSGSGYETDTIIDSLLTGAVISSGGGADTSTAESYSDTLSNAEVCILAVADSAAVFYNSDTDDIAAITENEPWASASGSDVYIEFVYGYTIAMLDEAT